VLEAGLTLDEHPGPLEVVARASGLAEQDVLRAEVERAERGRALLAELPLQELDVAARLLARVDA
jgi:hypothetical protein